MRHVVKTAILAAALVLATGSKDSCAPVDPVDPVCTMDTDCAPDETCQDSECLLSPCGEAGGTCHHFLDTCPNDSFPWTGMGCPMGRSGMCCLPQEASCVDDFGGICLWWSDPCPDGYGGGSPMDCPQGRSGQCCIPMD